MPLHTDGLSSRANHLIASLCPEDALRLTSLGRIAHPLQGAMLNSRAGSIDDVWFPINGVVALALTDNEGRHVQVGVVGPEGCVGVGALFPPIAALADKIVQVSGEMLAIPAGTLKAAAEAHPAIHVALTRFLYELSAQSLQTVACNRLHSLDSRCCRWLLMLQDRTGRFELPLTQESLATMLGSGRPRINGLLASLEKDGLLQRYRGRVRLLSRQGLKQRACECYRLLPYTAHVQRDALQPKMSP